MFSLTEDTFFDLLGLMGGILLAYAQIPQIYHIYVRKSSEDISYTYQAVFTIGLSMFVVYFAYYGLWPLLLTTLFSVLFSLSIGVLKLYLEKFSSKKRVPVSDNEDPAPLGAALLPADQLVKPNRHDSHGGAKPDVRGSSGNI